MSKRKDNNVELGITLEEFLALTPTEMNAWHRTLHPYQMSAYNDLLMEIVNEAGLTNKYKRCKTAVAQDEVIREAIAAVKRSRGIR